MVAAAHVHTIKRHGPDRCVGFTPIPAMSMASYAAGTRFLSLIGGVILSFYDWYADLPPSSPQVFGDQTDVPESGDWFNAGYLIIWGTNLPTTRTPDAHFMTEARYRGQKVVVVSPDYAEHTKFADHWLAAEPGSDGALAMAMGHVILKEFYVERAGPLLRGLRAPVHRPAAAGHIAGARGRLRPRPAAAGLRSRRLRRRARERRVEAGRDRRGHRRARRAERLGRPPLRRAGAVEPAPRRPRAGAQRARPRRRAGRRSTCRASTSATSEGGTVDPPRRPDDADRRPARDHGPRSDPRPLRRSPRGPARRLARRLRRPGALYARLAGADHDGRSPARRPRRPRVRPQRRADQRPLDDRDGRRHQPLVPLRSGLPDLPLAADDVRVRGASTAAAGRTTSARRRCARWPAGRRSPSRSTGCARRAISRARRSSTWRPISGATSATSRPTSPHRSVAGCSRAATSPTSTRSAPGLAGCRPTRASTAAPSTWPTRPSGLGSRSPTTSSPSCARAGCGSPARTPTRPDNHPKVMTVWRSNLLGSSGKGHEYFLKHLLGTAENEVRAEESPPELRPSEVRLARAGAGGQARPADHDRLPDDQQRALLRHRPAGGDLVREVRPLDDRPAPVRPRLQPGGAAAMGEQERLGHVRADLGAVLASWPSAISASAAT